ncbi:hypothetical protein [Acetobacter thailandicus]|uniref:hypothetical protein n=1 Tax=Acetobacter thailandicus TaxID=1502842 RepID=UPI001BAD610E|nr:hypothetical protein [Acetobacter thailandicus]MBS0985770.1 hypothetical protein [Acetobacter thailandicus]
MEPFTRNPPSHVYDPKELSEAFLLSLGCEPSGSNAQALVEEIAERMRPFIARQKDSATQKPSRNRDKGKPRRIKETGIILAGLMRHGIRGKWQRVHEGPSRWFWHKSRDLPLGHAAFWKKAHALRALNLLEYVQGKGWKNSWGDWQGEEARLRPSEELLRLAESYGCSRETAASDWLLVTPAPVPEEAEPVLIKPFFAGETLPLPSAPAGFVSFMTRLSEAIAEHTFAGCASPVLQKVFTGSLALHGRIYAQGGDSYQVMPKDYRRLITIDGEAVQEVDISASFLSIALARSGYPLPEGDPYALPGLDMEKHRQAVKQWFVITFGSGKLCNKWPPKRGHVAQSNIKAAEIKQAAQERYPFLSQLQGIVPADVMAVVPESEKSKAVGQYLMCLEAQIMTKAIDDIIRDGGIALPMHDALIVPASWSERARKAIEQASKARLGQALRVSIQ